MRPLTKAEYDIVLPLVSQSPDALSFDQLEELDAVYRAYSNAAPSDLYCDDCISELHRRVKAHLKDFVSAQLQTEYKRMDVPPESLTSF